jgi:glycine dehydrogenase subunit 2
MIEPTETEGKETLDDFVAAMEAIYNEALTDPDLVKRAPHTLPLKRVDEAEAARRPILRWTPKND